jgi:hypothetical protein
MMLNMSFAALVFAAAHAAPADDAIASRVKERFIFHRSEAAADVEVAVSSGAVTLRGNAINEEYKNLASAYAREAVGVISVDNQMIIAGLAAPVKDASPAGLNAVGANQPVRTSTPTPNIPLASKPSSKSPD